MTKITPLSYIDARLKHTLMQLEHLRKTGQKEHDAYFDLMIVQLTDELEVLEKLKLIVYSNEISVRLKKEKLLEEIPTTPIGYVEKLIEDCSVRYRNVNIDPGAISNPSDREQLIREQEQLEEEFPVLQKIKDIVKRDATRVFDEVKLAEKNEVRVYSEEEIQKALRVINQSTEEIRVLPWTPVGESDTNPGFLRRRDLASAYVRGMNYLEVSNYPDEKLQELRNRWNAAVDKTDQFPQPQ